MNGDERTAARATADARGGRVLLAIVPHPDDEAYSMGGTLALAAARGDEVHLLCVTRGQFGRADRDAASPEAVAAVRSAELAASCRVLGVRPPIFLDYRDGALDRVDLAEAAGAIVRVIRFLRPDVVLSLGADGVYGHPDHIALHKLV